MAFFTLDFLIVVFSLSSLPFLRCLSSQQSTKDFRLVSEDARFTVAFGLKTVLLSGLDEKECE
ncbi:hypothetical protein HMPREF0294_1189 [Corynebacterium glucuronolyticum ATCC 51867]|nr:hypothetical protein HMPREF0294_1189 [Corynebacterium glucuronolyticum ATCC 51867]